MLEDAVPFGADVEADRVKVEEHRTGVLKAAAGVLEEQAKQAHPAADYSAMHALLIKCADHKDSIIHPPPWVKSLAVRTRS